MKVTVADIVGWGTTREAQDQLPVLVRRLLRTTTPHLTALDFPGGDAVRLAGFDGECRSETATPWCPEGRTVWEMGCSDRPAAKADGDWEKRMRAPEAERRDATFIFVTPRLWDGKRAWVE